jgi:hypothetical protein
MAATPIAVSPTGGKDDDGEPFSGESDEAADSDDDDDADADDDDAGLIDSSVP